MISRDEILRRIQYAKTDQGPNYFGNYSPSDLLRVRMPNALGLSPNDEETHTTVNNMVADYIDKANDHANYHKDLKNYITFLGPERLRNQIQVPKHPLPVHVLMDHVLEQGMTPQEITHTMVNYLTSHQKYYSRALSYLTQRSQSSDLKS